MSNDTIAKGIIADIQAGFNMNVNIDGTLHKVNFFKFTGSEKLVYTDNSLMFTVRRGKGRAAVRCVITLNAMDTYDIEFYTIRNFEAKKMKEIKDIYNDRLTETLRRELDI